mmetsp:Transcript_19347/g.57493  ORF Transcript_19347/g.57493 Transcript_19347/m.57493 type:complete len:312 (-) Transcript_19347:25-960(-)
MLPASPLAEFRRSIGQTLRTGLSPAFEKTAASTLTAAKDVRQRCRSGALRAPTAGLANGHAQANLVAVPRAHAFDFARFCLLNPKPCPLLAIAERYDAVPAIVAAGCDLRTDIPKYRIWRDGEPSEEVADASEHWGDDFVGFLLGCSFSWEDALTKAGHPPRHVAEGRNVPMYQTNVPNAASGPFGGALVVSMRPYPPEAVEAVAALTAAYPAAHGAPVHWGDPAALGVADLGRPDFGDAVTVAPGEVPVFWACGVTPQSALAAARLPLAITHAPGHMLVLDLRDADLLDESGDLGNGRPLGAGETACPTS